MNTNVWTKQVREGAELHYTPPPPPVGSLSVFSFDDMFSLQFPREDPGIRHLLVRLRVLLRQFTHRQWGTAGGFNIPASGVSLLAEEVNY